ncbi:interleukin-2 receptor subunit beta isoform X2 [Anabas testudineus]|uniref:Fibronectin type-III domain-containing protein n=1 Tax=Anabas testudineus TaxID=64144 RepID=A0A3Q1HJN6_ANATE|nr:interleukin-2 receptor subunit beta isoform X2 [Anabas testudineus]
MSHTASVTMKTLWSSYLLVALCSAHAARSHKVSAGTQGLSCINDFFNNISCTWSGAPVAPGVDCWIMGVRKTSKMIEGTRHSLLIKKSCRLKQHRISPPGCSFVFENEPFNFFEVMPNISIECNGTMVDSIKHYKPYDHIKMHPPGVPNVSTTANGTRISWTPGSPLNELFKTFDFEVQVIQKNQTWKEAHTFSTQDQDITIPSWQLKGICHVRVRVKYSKKADSHWSNWSPTASWMGEIDMEVSQDQDWPWVKTGVQLCIILFVIILTIYGSCVISGRLKRKPVPNPSKYFHTLHSVHRGNLKKWLNPTSESFFTAQTRDHISPVEVCESWDVVPSSSPSSSSNSALLHFQSYPSASSDTSGIVDNFSSSSSSCFYNMGYFVSDSSSSSGRADPSPAYFTYKDEFHNLINDHNLHVSLCPSFTTLPVYEILKREPQSPDSGFGIGKEDEEDRKEEMEMSVEGEEVSDDPQSPLHIILPLHLPSRMCPASSTPPPPRLPSPTQKSSDSQQTNVPVVVSGSYAAWPVGSAMCRSSSMPVEPCKTGYLTLKELQTTFSNKSI